MNPLNRTLTFAATAGVTAVVALASWYSTQPAEVSGFSEVGKELFPDFNNVEQATDLEVQDYDSKSKRLASFSVKQNDDNLWVIPSHHSYPAEAKDRLAQTATSLMGVRKKAVQSRSKDDWKRYGVVDPAASGSAKAEERGTRLTLRDTDGNSLVDLIVGNAVENRDGHFYVREPETNTTFIAEMSVDLSAKFSDWIEPDLLKTTANDLIAITLDNYSINEQQGTIEKTELLDFAKTDLSPTGTWEMVGLDPEKEELDTSPISTIATNLAGLKIVGVRPKPKGLNSNMRIDPTVKQILQMQMQAQGYFIAADREGNERLYSNDGELVAGDSSGVQYTLYFGEIARGTQQDIEVGLDGEADTDDEEKEEAATEDDSGPNRYLLVKVEFNDALLGEKPIEPLEPQLPEILRPSEEPAGEEKSGDSAAQETSETPQESENSEDEPDDCGPQEDEPAQEDESPKKIEPTQEDTPAASEQTATTEETGDGQTPGEEAAPAQEAVGEATEQSSADSGEATETKPQQTEAAAQEAPKEDPKVVARRQYDAALAAYRGAMSEYERELKAYESKVETGQKKADELYARFDRWYYVISSESFEKFRVTRKDVVSAKSDKDTPAADGAAPGGLPQGLPNGLPPGLIPGAPRQ